MQARDWEGALVNLFPALDKTAKRRRPKDGVGPRIRAFLEDEEALISALATGNVMTNIITDGVSITDALYKFGRTAIAHEGELDPRLKFNDTGSIQIGSDRWDLPSGYVFGMSVAVIVAPENTDEQVTAELALTVFGEAFRVNDLWGQRERVRALVARRFKRPDLFLRR